MIATDGKPTVADPVNRPATPPETAASYRPAHGGYPGEVRTHACPDCELLRKLGDSRPCRRHR
jgi:hypothetical protein